MCRSLRCASLITITAKGLSRTVPPTLLARDDEAIE
jgi:hypothetical protein